MSPKDWDAAVVPGDPGHVAFVESVNTDGTITVSEYNHDGLGNGDTRTGKPSDMGFTEYVDFGVHPSSSGTSSGRIITRGGSNLYDVTMTAGWQLDSNTASAGNWKLSGDRLANSDSNGLWVMDGATGAWTKASSPVDEFQISSTRIVTRAGSNLYDVTPTGAWHLVSNTASAGSWKLSGNRLANMDANGLWVMDGTSDTWHRVSVPVDEYQISSTRIITRGGSNLYDVTMTAGWTLISSTASPGKWQLVGDRVANLDSNGLWIKDGSAGWVRWSNPDPDEYQISATKIVSRVGTNLWENDGSSVTAWTLISSTASPGKWQLVGDRVANSDTNSLWIKDGTGPWTKVSTPVDEFQIS